MDKAVEKKLLNLFYHIHVRLDGLKRRHNSERFLHYKCAWFEHCEKSMNPSRTSEELTSEIDRVSKLSKKLFKRAFGHKRQWDMRKESDRIERYNTIFNELRSNRFRDKS
jgi:hypothetical protein